MKPKVLIIQEYIPHYRVPIFNLLAERVNLNLIFSEGATPAGAKFNVQYIPKKEINISILGKTVKRYYSTISYYRIARNYDVVICIAKFDWLDIFLLQHLPHKYKLLYWGIGVAATYDLNYDSNPQVANIICKHIKSSDGMIFYSDYPVWKYKGMGIDESKLFVANNTVEVIRTAYSSVGRDKILFVGTLYKAKKVELLINAYHNAYLKNKSIPDLILIGDGSERIRYEKMVEDYMLSHKISFAGQIIDERILSNFFSQAIMCISPNQAGLSVLKSMGYGVPYVTHKNAITGGEIFNIHNHIDGILLDDFAELESIILDAGSYPEKFYEMGKNAYDYYYANRMPEHMVNGFVRAINSVTNY